MRAVWTGLAVLALAACEHSAPSAVEGHQERGPWSPSYPRRLTFYSLDDRMPGVSGNWLLYSRQSHTESSAYGPNGREYCVAFLPVEGGTIARTLCPHRFLPPNDTFVDTWMEPVLSPDGTRLAFTWQRAARVGVLAWFDMHLMVTPVDRPADTTQFRQYLSYFDPRGVFQRWGTVASRLAWVDANRLRFLVTWEHIFKVKGGGAGRVTDTIFEPLALMEADLTTREVRLVPGGDSAVAWAPAPDGGIWIVREADSSAVLRLDPVTGAATEVGRFPGPVYELAQVHGVAVAVTERRGAIDWLDPGSGIVVRLAAFTTPIRRLAAADGRRVVVEVEQDNLPFGAPSDLWLLEVP